jgi:hypothetical protein
MSTDSTPASVCSVHRGSLSDGEDGELEFGLLDYAPAEPADVVMDGKWVHYSFSVMNYLAQCSVNFIHANHADNGCSDDEITAALHSLITAAKKANTCVISCTFKIFFIF